MVACKINFYSKYLLQIIARAYKLFNLTYKNTNYIKNPPEILKY